MMYLATSINESPVIAEKAGVAIADVRGRAVKFANGAVVLVGAGEAAIGIGIMTNDETIKQGDDITVQVKDMGVVYAGAAITKGAELAVGENGALVPATEGKYVVAIALEEATDAGVFIKVQLAKYKI